MGETTTRLDPNGLEYWQRESSILRSERDEAQRDARRFEGESAQLRSRLAAVERGFELFRRGASEIIAGWERDCDLARSRAGELETERAKEKEYVVRAKERARELAAYLTGPMSAADLVTAQAIYQSIVPAAAGPWHENPWRGNGVEAIVSALEAAREGAHDHITDLLAIIDRDHTGLAAALSEVRAIAAGFDWICEGRGPYAYDDERYRMEVGILITKVVEAASKALTESGARVTEAFIPRARLTAVALEEACADEDEKGGRE